MINSPIMLASPFLIKSIIHFVVYRHTSKAQSTVFFWADY